MTQTFLIGLVEGWVPFLPGIQRAWRESSVLFCADLPEGSLILGSFCSLPLVFSHVWLLLSDSSRDKTKEDPGNPPPRVAVS